MVDVLVMSGSIATGNNPIVIEGEDLKVNGTITQGGVNVVTISETQTLTNKTINGDNNTISNLAHGSEVDDPSSGVHGVTGNVVGTSDAQTLSNKTLSGATVSSGNLVLSDDGSTILVSPSGSQTSDTAIGLDTFAQIWALDSNYNAWDTRPTAIIYDGVNHSRDQLEWWLDDGNNTDPRMTLDTDGNLVIVGSLTQGGTSQDAEQFTATKLGVTSTDEHFGIEYTSGDYNGFPKFGMRGTNGTLGAEGPSLVFSVGGLNNLGTIERTQDVLFITGSDFSGAAVEDKAVQFYLDGEDGNFTTWLRPWPGLVAGTTRPEFKIEADTITVNGDVDMYGGAGALNLREGGSNHVYVQFFPQNSAPTTRRAYLGFASSGTTAFTIQNEYAGPINLDATEIKTLASVRAIDGSNGVPAYSFTSDDDTGMFLDAVGTLSLTTAGAVRLNVNSTAIEARNIPFRATNTTSGHFGHTGWSANTYITSNLYYAGSGDRTQAVNWRYISGAGASSTAGWALHLAANGAEIGQSVSLYSVPTSTDADDTPTSFTERLRITSAQLLFGIGDIANPAYSFLNDTNTGMYRVGPNDIGFAVDGALGFRVNSGFVYPYKQIRHVGNGSAGAPSYAFNNDPDTGMYLVSDGNLGFSVGNANRLQISTASIIPQAPIRGTDASRIVPAYSFSNDTNIGLYRVGSNHVGYVGDVHSFQTVGASTDVSLRLYQTSTLRAEMKYEDTGDWLALRTGGGGSMVDRLVFDYIDANECRSYFTNGQVYNQEGTRITAAGDLTLDWDEYNQVAITNPGARTINIDSSSMQDGGHYCLIVEYSTGGVADWDWTSLGGTLRWQNGQEPIFSTATLGDQTVITFIKSNGGVLGFWATATV
jgi:hypothetical protein